MKNKEKQVIINLKRYYKLINNSFTKFLIVHKYLYDSLLYASILLAWN